MTTDMSVFGIIARASNIRSGKNPSYTCCDFLAMYPQFGVVNEVGERVIPNVVMESWLKMANAVIS